ncbi:MAG: hypothetical protein NZ826_02235 [Thermodesulfovibrio sp.]|nr:hypothetical protein [Thermodesulfovibrio sp.]
MKLGMREGMRERAGKRGWIKMGRRRRFLFLLGCFVSGNSRSGWKESL